MRRAAQTVEAVEGRRKRRSPDTQRTPAESICIVGGCKAENRQYVETGGNCSVRRGYYGSGVRWMQKSLCSPQTMPADRSGLGRIWQEDAARGRAFEMDAAATFSDPPASQAGGIHARTPVAGIVLMPTRRLRPLITARYRQHILTAGLPDGVKTRSAMLRRGKSRWGLANRSARSLIKPRDSLRGGG